MIIFPGYVLVTWDGSFSSILKIGTKNRCNDIVTSSDEFSLKCFIDKNRAFSNSKIQTTWEFFFQNRHEITVAIGREG